MCDSKFFEKTPQIKNIGIDELVRDNFFSRKDDSKGKKNIAAIFCLLQNIF
jgi:hypothetical protein